MKHILTLVIVTIAGQSAFAQDSLSVRKYDFPIMLDITQQAIQTKELNDALVANGYNKLPSNLWTLGVTNTLYRGRFGIGTSFDAVFSNRVASNADHTARMLGAIVGPHFSYYIFQTKTLVFYPTIAFRTAFLSLRTYDKSTVGSVNDVLSQDHRSATIQYTSDVIDIGLGMSTIRGGQKRKFDCPQAERYRSFGVRVGYNINTGTRGFYGFTRLHNSPMLELKGFYIRVGYGFGTRFTRVHWK